LVGAPRHPFGTPMTAVLAVVGFKQPGHDPVLDYHSAGGVEGGVDDSALPAGGPAHSGRRLGGYGWWRPNSV
jgi:hypothetical protein